VLIPFPRPDIDVVVPLSLGASKILLVDPFVCPIKANVTAVLRAFFDELNGR
jgi:hypothetical protein